MPWATSNRRERLPADWQARRRFVLERCGHRCEWMISRGERCPEKATDVDHIKPGDDHSLRNLRGLCAKHHARKSSSEGWWARHRLIEESKRKFQRQETHPAYLNADGTVRGGCWMSKIPMRTSQLVDDRPSRVDRASHGVARPTKPHAPANNGTKPLKTCSTRSLKAGKWISGKNQTGRWPISRVTT